MPDGGAGCTCQAACACTGELPPFSAEAFLREVNRVRAPVARLPEIGAADVARVWAGPAAFEATPGDYGFGIPPTVDLYVPTGPHDADDASCSFENDRRCSLWRVRVRLRTFNVVEVDRYRSATDSRGLIQPAVSSDGRFIAYVMRDREDGKAFASEAAIRVRDLATDDKWTPFRGVPKGGDPMPQFPAWDRGDSPGLWHHTQDSADAGTLYLTYGRWLGHSSDYTAAMVGPGSGSGEDESWKDVAVSAEGVKASNGATLRYVSFGGAPLAGDWEQLPRVHNAVGVGVEKFDESGLAPATQCHHPAWSPRAQEVVCAAKGTRTEFGDRRYLSIFTFQQRGPAGAEWRTEGYAFDPPTPEELSTLLGASFVEAARFVTLTYPVFVGTGQFILFTIQAKNAAEECTFARVFVVNRLATTNRFLDVTAAVEDHLGVARGSYRSVFGCGVAA